MATISNEYNLPQKIREARNGALIQMRTLRRIVDKTLLGDVVTAREAHRLFLAIDRSDRPVTPVAIRNLMMRAELF